MRYIALHKPYGVLSQFTGAPIEQTLAQFQLPKGIYAAGRLDKDSEGLLLLTDDGPLKHKLLNPKSKHKKIYWVQVEGIPTFEALQQLQRGVEIKGYRTKPCTAIAIPPPDVPDRDPPIRKRKSIPTSWISITLHEGKNRQVRRMTAKVGYPTLRLIRVQIEGIQLGTLQAGEWREVSKKQIFSR